MHKVHSINTKIHEIKYKNQIHLTNPQSTLDETQRKMTTKFNIFLGNRWWQWNYNDSSNVASHIALWMANHLVSNIEGRGLSQATDILHQLQDFLRQLLSEQMAAASLVFIFKTEGRGTESERYAETWWIKVNHSNRISHEISVRLLLGLTIWVACAHIGTGNINRARRSAWKQLISGSWQLENYARVHRSAVHTHHVLFQTCLWYVFIWFIIYRYVLHTLYQPTGSFSFLLLHV